MVSKKEISDAKKTAEKYDKTNIYRCYMEYCR